MLENLSNSVTIRESNRYNMVSIKTHLWQRYNLYRMTNCPFIQISSKEISIVCIIKTIYSILDRLV